MQVRPPAVMRRDLRARAGLRQQRVYLIDGSLLLAGLTGGDDRIEPRPVRADPDQVLRLASGAGERVPVGHRLQVCQRPQPFPGSGPPSVDQLNETGHGLELVSIKMTLTPVFGAR